MNTFVLLNLQLTELPRQTYKLYASHTSFWLAGNTSYHCHVSGLSQVRLLTASLLEEIPLDSAGPQAAGLCDRNRKLIAHTHVLPLQVTLDKRCVRTKKHDPVTGLMELTLLM